MTKHIHWERWLVGVGAVLWTSACCLPWLIVTGNVQFGISFGLIPPITVPIFAQFLYNPDPALVSHFAHFAPFSLRDIVEQMAFIPIAVGPPMLGLALAALLWQPLTAQARRNVRWALGAWLGVTTLSALWSIGMLLTSTLFPVDASVDSYNLVVQMRTPASGMFLGLFALMLLWIGMVWHGRVNRTEAHTVPLAQLPPPPAIARLGALLVVLGMALWSLSYALLYWAIASDCSVLPFRVSQCTARYSASDAIFSLVDQHAPAFTTTVSLWLLYLLLVGSAISGVWLTLRLRQMPLQPVLHIWLIAGLVIVTILTVVPALGSRSLSTISTFPINMTLAAPLAFCACLLGWGGYVLMRVRVTTTPAKAMQC